MNRHIIYKPLSLKEQAINRWLVCGPFEQAMTFTPVTMEGEINDWLIKGFSIHDNPCRVDFVRERRQLPPAYCFEGSLPQPGDSRQEADQHREWETYMPWGNPRIECSGFWFVPTLLVSYAVTELRFDRRERAGFRLRTCGAATLWVNGHLVVDFVPYTRNMVKELDIEINVQEGMNRFELRLEDLAERDTEYYFRLDYQGAQFPDIAVSMGSINPVELHEFEKSLEEAYFAKETVIDGDVVLQLSNPIGREIQVDVSWGNFLDGIRAEHASLLPEQRQLVLGHCEQIGMGYKYVSLNFWLDGVKISKRFGLETHLSKYDLPQAEHSTVSKRKIAALRCIAEQGSRNIHTAIAMLHTGGDVSAAERIIKDGIQRINAREDCSDFYLVGLFQLWKDFRNTDTFAPKFWDSVKLCIVNFRYWIDEPGDDVMWFFSENHALLFHTCELLAGQFFPNERFSNNGETGSEHLRKAEARLIHWFSRFSEEGLAEWNSNAYIPIDAVGLLHLYALAESDKLRSLAKRAMDQLFYYITLHAHQGRMMSTFGRSYEKELKGHYAAGTTSMCWIAYGIGNVNAYSISNVIYGLTDYEPPSKFRDFLSPNENGLVFQYEQGVGGYARLYNYKTKEFVLSSIQDFRPGKPGYQEHVVHYAATPSAQLWVNHPGELHSYGSGRPCFWAGNGTLPKVGQYRGLAVILFRLEDQHDVDYTHAYLPIDEFDEWRKCDNWVMVRKGDAYAALWCMGGMKLTESGGNRRREWISPGKENVWVLRASNAHEYGDFERFVEQMQSTHVQVSGDLEVNLRDPKYGLASIGWQLPWQVNGKHISVEGAGVNGRLEQ